MLHKQTVEPGTLSLLKELMQLPELSDFNLVGGTAISLKYGHRKSIDLDLFSFVKFDNLELEQRLKAYFKDRFVYENVFSKWGIFCYIDNVKVDIVYYPHALVETIEIVEGIRMLSDKDLIAMKVQAVLGRGKKKDFWDIAELLSKYTIQDFIDFHKQKFPSQMLGISVPTAITYFTDADDSEDPETIKKQSWNDIKKFISKKVRDFLI
ncbi:MAG: nucleotidyl transferase AbiEii/AbiGii toxin family protein [Paludibacter sp.]|nr:nucleotidyl transferase AbiEii/AbiGii toxin family protein [Paludibacter sp.]